MNEDMLHKRERNIPLQEPAAHGNGQGMLDDGSAESLRLLAHLYLLHQKPNKAAVLLQALRELGSDEPEVLRALCRALLLSGRHAEALEISDTLRGPAAARRSSALATLCEARLRAEALWGLGYADEARRTLESALDAATRADSDFSEPE